LQFSLRAEFIDSTVVGVSSAQRVTETRGLAAMPIPEDLWDELESLVPPSSAWLDSPGA
jgi:D-threo-aldose 1-dehydrogenase